MITLPEISVPSRSECGRFWRRLQIAVDAWNRHDPEAGKPQSIVLGFADFQGLLLIAYDQVEGRFPTAEESNIDLFEFCGIKFVCCPTCEQGIMPV